MRIKQPHTLSTELSSQLFYSLSLALFSKNSPSKASSLLFIFARISTGHAHFLNDEIRISRVPMRYSTVFLSCKMPEKSTRKVGLKV